MAAAAPADLGPGVIIILRKSAFVKLDLREFGEIVTEYQDRDIRTETSGQINQGSLNLKFDHDSRLDEGVFLFPILVSG